MVLLWFNNVIMWWSWCGLANPLCFCLAHVIITNATISVCFVCLGSSAPVVTIPTWPTQNDSLCLSGTFSVEKYPSSPQLRCLLFIFLSLSPSYSRAILAAPRPVIFVFSFLTDLHHIHLHSQSSHALNLDYVRGLVCKVIVTCPGSSISTIFDRLWAKRFQKEYTSIRHTRENPPVIWGVCHTHTHTHYVIVTWMIKKNETPND